MMVFEGVMKRGLMGGTFDPVHFGHLRCAQEILELFDLEEVIFIPTARPALKTQDDIAVYSHREKMVRLAIEGNPSFTFSGIEQERKGKSYTIDTVRHFRAESAGAQEIYFIMGRDAFLDIRRWKDWEKLLMMCNFVIMTRPGTPVGELEDALPADYAARFRYDEETDGFVGPDGTALFFRRVTLLDISSSDIRRRVQGGHSIRYLVPDRVEQYIVEHGLYLAGERSTLR